MMPLSQRECALKLQQTILSSSRSTVQPVFLCAYEKPARRTSKAHKSIIYFTFMLFMEYSVGGMKGVDNQHFVESSTLNIVPGYGSSVGATGSHGVIFLVTFPSSTTVKCRLIMDCHPYNQVGAQHTN